MSAYRGAGGSWDGGPPGIEPEYAPQQAAAYPPQAARPLPTTDPWTGASYNQYPPATYDYQQYPSGSYAGYGYDPSYYQRQDNTYYGKYNEQRPGYQQAGQNVYDRPQNVYHSTRSRSRSPVPSRAYEHRRRSYDSHSRSSSPVHRSRRDYSRPIKRETSYENVERNSRSRSRSKKHSRSRKYSSSSERSNYKSRSSSRSTSRKRSESPKRQTDSDSSIDSPVKKYNEKSGNRKNTSRRSSSYDKKSQGTPARQRSPEKDRCDKKEIKHKKQDKSSTDSKSKKSRDSPLPTKGRSSLTPPRSYKLKEKSRSITPPKSYRSRTPRSARRESSAHSQKSSSPSSPSRASKGQNLRKRSISRSKRSGSSESMSPRESRSDSKHKAQQSHSKRRSQSRERSRYRRRRSLSKEKRKGRNRSDSKSSSQSKSRSRSRSRSGSYKRRASRPRSQSASSNESCRGQFTVADRKRFWKRHKTRQEKAAESCTKTPPREPKPPPGAVEPAKVDDIEYGDPPEVEGPNFAELPLADQLFLKGTAASKSKPVPLPIRNDGSFLEMFKKMQEVTKVEEEKAKPEIKKPILPFIGKRRGGRVLKTGLVKKPRAIDEQPADNTPKDAWSLYMQEVKKYRETSCEEERKTRPLVK